MHRTAEVKSRNTAGVAHPGRTTYYVRRSPLGAGLGDVVLPLVRAPRFVGRAFRSHRLLAVVTAAAAIALVVLGGSLAPGEGGGVGGEAVGANVADEVSAANTIDARCAPAPADCAKTISDTIRNNRARPLKVTFGSGTGRGTVFNFNSELRVASDVAVVGINQPTVRAKATNLVRIGGKSNLAFEGFDLDLDQCRTTKNVFFNGKGERFSNIHISDMRVYNGDSENGRAGSCVFFGSRGTGTDLHLNNITAEFLRRVVWFNTTSNHNKISITDMTASDFGYQALSFDGYVEDLLIDSSSFHRHASNVKGSHMIAFSPAETLTEVKSRNVVVRNSLLEGREDIPHIKINGVTQPNGASGDLIAVRGTDGFLLENNIFRHSGEVGITITAGARNGIVRNNTISFTDTTGIVLGNGNTIRVTNIDTYNNELFQNSLDRDGTHNPFPALSLWGVTDSCVVHNNIHDNTVATGLWVWNGHMPPTWPRSVKNMYVTQNTFDNNLHDFVQSRRPTRDFEPANSNGGENWTSTFGSPDRDGDGFGDVCSSETNDNDPCVPFAGAPACNDPAEPTTTTTAPPTTVTTPPTTEATTTTTVAPPTTAPGTTTPGTTASTTTVTTPPSTGTTPTTAPGTTVPGPTTAPTTTVAPPPSSVPVDPAPIISVPPDDEFICNGLPATIIGTEGDDVIFGTNRRDVIVGLGGNDVIYGEIGPDVICGGEGDDELRGGRENDYLSGGPGNDVLKGGRNNDTIFGEDGDDIIFGNTGRDTLYGGNGRDEVRGNAGRDTLDGGSGVDYLAGNGDRDILLGGSHNDTLLGGSQGDLLDGGTGSDACAAGSGADREGRCERTPRSAVDEYDSKIDEGNLD